MDSNDQGKRRGITILARNTALINWNGYHINIVDTPATPTSAAVERVMSMVDSVLLWLMPKTAGTTGPFLRDQEAFETGLRQRGHQQQG
jgi:GTP-binding protein